MNDVASYEFTYKGKRYYNEITVDELTKDRIELIAKNMIETFEEAQNANNTTSK